VKRHQHPIVANTDIIAAEWSEWDEQHRRQSNEGRSERARAANEFQIANDLRK
jgi:hypothetical protein